MGATHDVMEDFKKDDWPASKLENQAAMSMKFQGTNGRWSCHARVEEYSETVLFTFVR